MEDLVQSANINEKWLNNIYENIKNLEDYERLVREGCASLLDFMNIPQRDRKIVIGLTKFKNLSFLVTEFKLLLADLTPVIKNSKEYDEILDNIDNALRVEKLFIKTTTNVHNQVVEVKTTDFFNATLTALHNLKRDLFKEIKGILYIQSSNGP